MFYNYKPLRAKISQQGYSIATLAAEIGIAPNVLRMKLYSWKEFTLEEIHKISDLLGLSKYEIERYFFTYKFL